MTIALVGSLAVTANLLMTESRESIEDNIERELSAFRSFSLQALDPTTGEPFTSASSLLTQYLATAVTSNQELLFTVVDGQPVQNVQLDSDHPSAVELNVRGDELTERFVRGDASRNTEGSGLGLAIARSFTEAQKGSLHISVDGDLFKVVILWK